MQNSAFKTLTISPNDAPRLIEEFIGPKDIGKRTIAEPEGDMDKI